MSLLIGVVPLDITSAVVMLTMLSVIIVAIVFSIPLALIMTYHKRKMEEIRLKRMGMMTEEVKAEFAALRGEINALRDTTMQYDLSFDTSRISMRWWICSGRRIRCWMASLSVRRSTRGTSRCPTCCPARGRHHREDRRKGCQIS